jgi:hypothetical protein
MPPVSGNQGQPATLLRVRRVRDSSLAFGRWNDEEGIIPFVSAGEGKGRHHTDLRARHILGTYAVKVTEA